MKIFTYFLCLCVVIATVLRFTDSHAHHHHDHEEHNENKQWKQVTTWNFAKGLQMISFCTKDDSLTGNTLVIQRINSTNLKEAVNESSHHVEDLFSTFSSTKVPRVEVSPSGVIKPHEKKEYNIIYRVKLATEHDHDHHGHDHHHHGHHSHHAHTHSKLQSPGHSHDNSHKHNSSECGGNGHLHGVICHCDTDYILDQKNWSNCVSVSKYMRSDCNGKAAVWLNISSSGPYFIFSEHRLDDLGAEIKDVNGKLTSFSSCIEGCDDKDHTSDSLSIGLRWGYTIIACLIVSAISLIGIVFLSIKKKAIMKHIVDIMVSFAAGTLVATVIFHLYPEANEYLEDVEGDWQLSCCILAGILFGMMVEQGLHIFLHKNGVSHHDHHHVHCDSSNVEHHHVEDLEQSPTTKYNDSVATKVQENVKSSWFTQIQPVAWIVGLGDFFHAFVDGVLITIAFCSCNAATGWLVTFAICLHEVPHRLSDFFIFIKAGMTVLQAVLFNLVVSSSTLVGAIIVLGFGNVSNHTLGYVLGFGSGALLFIGLSELIPSMLVIMDLKKAVTNVLVFCVGVFVIGLTMLQHTHCDVDGHVHSH